MMIIKGVGFGLLILGLVVNWFARRIVQKKQWDKQQVVKYAEEMSEDEQQKYRENMAMLKVKLVGAALLLLGITLVFLGNHLSN